MKDIKKQSGFTLVEVLLYLGLAVTILSLSSVFLFQISQFFVKQRTITEVTQQSLRVIDLISTTVRNGASVTSPTQGNQSSSVTIATDVPATNPTVYSLSSGTIYISEGGGDNTALTNKNIIISNLLFRNMSHTNTTGTIEISFTSDYSNPQGRAEFSYQEAFAGAASLRLAN